MRLRQRGKHAPGPPKPAEPRSAVDLWDHQEVPLSARRLVELIRPAVKLVWIASPRETIYLVVSQTITGLVLPAQVLAGKWALDSILQASRTGGGLEDALPAVVIALTAMTAGQCLATSSRHRSRLLPELVGRASQEMLAKKATTLDLQALETPAFHDRLVRAQHDAAFRPANMVTDMARIVSSSVAVLGLAVLLFTVHPLLLLGLLVTMLPLAWSNMTGGRDYYRNAVRRTPRRRIIQYLQYLLTMLDSAKETRAFGLGPYLLARHGELYDEELDEFRRVVGQRQRREVFATLAGSIVNAAGVVFILWLHFSQRISLPEAIAASGALLLLLPRIGNLVTAIGLMHENALFVEDLWSFLAVEPKQSAPISTEPVPSTFQTLRVEDLSFSYPNRPEPVLDHVSLEINLGETVAVVGENGAGKTTLAKLLCRLYDPDGGTISWEGRDIATCDPDELRARIAVIFQDFVRYELSAKDNIGFGDLASLDDLDAVVEAARHAGADEFIDDLPEGYDTRLGRRFHKGHDLSIGQWQRLALARAFFRDAPLVIMDEPTASLDARAESELFHTMGELFDDRAVLLISHRFSSVRMADRIYVLQDGKIAESGTHDGLMASGGLYSELFSLQASAYLERRQAAE
ncbi:MAG: Efflux ABC transporter, permease/ATP-binding protein [uncultured Solirubrobacteraceae bacterium]|uniref:Efflux ABC transporter, permease/ATP-binding protein n=1 Tax=uncultured Solirubrobacteraceae bacterium TaxID=1162706 RepID=A0A6J4RIG0_9ACTN|nr:MAG: Efflux ABC transporter, permease/ATP-binding protein [uncultured Solirubrobacteraceae bacterium]